VGWFLTWANWLWKGYVGCRLGMCIASKSLTECMSFCLRFSALLHPHYQKSKNFSSYVMGGVGRLFSAQRCLVALGAFWLVRALVWG
jgi:hypothetical protein